MIYFISFICGVFVFQISRTFPYLSLLSAALLIALLFFRKGLDRPDLVPAIIIVTIAASGFYHAAKSYEPQPSFADLAGTIKIHGIIRSEPKPLNPEADMFSQIMEVEEAMSADGKSLNLRELRIIFNKPLTAGMEYIAKVRTSKDAFLLNPGNGSKVLSVYIDDIKEGSRPDAGLFARSRSKLISFFRDNFSAQSAPFLMSIVTGERGLLSRETNSAFNVTGLAHILSISGSHFGMLFFFLFSMSMLLARFIPYSLLVRVTLYLTPRQIAAAICVPFVTFYLGLSDMGFPAIRAFIMIIFFLFGLLTQRKGFWLNTLLLSAVIIIIIQPDSVLDLSFQLSFIAVLCIGLVTESQSGSQQEVVHHAEVRKPGREEDPEPGSSFPSVVQTYRSTALQRFKDSVLPFFRASTLISLAATAGTAPLVSCYFHYFSPVSPLTNLLMTPLIGFIILPLSLLSSFFFLVFGRFPLLPITEWITEIMLELIQHIAGWPFIVINIPAFPPILLVMFYAGLILYVVLKISGIKGRTIALLLPSSMAVLPAVLYIFIKIFEPAGMLVTYLDVGEGDAAVIELPGGKTIVSDTGKNGLQVSEYLRYRGIDKIEAVVLSHGDNDHAGGWKYLRENFQISELWDSGNLIYEDGIPETIRHRVLQRGDVTEGQGYSITALHPYEDFYSISSQGNANNNSLVVKIEGRNNAFMFTGDIESEAAENISYLGKYLKSSVLKVPHHGSRTSASGPFFSAVSPEIAVISVGRGNAYNHPHPDTLELLSKARIYRTDLDGAIGIREMPDAGLRVRTARGMRVSEAHNLDDEVLNVKRLFQSW